ncbi:MAG: HEAT repeat domain-containing protein [Thiohalomonadales bacterium]
MMNIEVLVESLGTTSHHTLQGIRAKLCASGGESVVALAQALRHRNHDIAVQAAVVLGLLPQEDAVLANPALIELAGSRQVELRRACISTLGRICQLPEETLPRLALALADDDVIVRRYAAAAIGMFYHAAITVADNLIIALSDNDNTVRYFALSSLEDINPLPVSVLARLHRIQRHSELSTKLGIRRIIQKIEIEAVKNRKIDKGTQNQQKTNRRKKQTVNF